MRNPFAWILRRRLICAIRRHPSEVRLTRYMDRSTRWLVPFSRAAEIDQNWWKLARRSTTPR